MSTNIKNLDIVLEHHNSSLVVWLHAHWRRRQTLISAIFVHFKVQTSATLTMVLRHTVIYHSSTSAIMTDFVQIVKDLVDRWMHRRADRHRDWLY